MTSSGSETALPRKRRRMRMPTRVRRASIVSVIIGGFCVGAVVAATARESVPNPAAGGPHISLVGKGEAFSIAWLGDTLLGDAGQPLLDLYGLTWPAAHVPPPADADLVIANAEGPFTDHVEAFDPLQRWSYQAQPRTAGALAAIGIDAISLSNNHVMDRGPTGLFDTMTHARAAGLLTFGGGSTSEQARLPLMIKTDIGTIAVVGFADDSGLNIARRDRPGIRQLSPKSIVEDIQLARRAGADRVVAHVQWGENYAPLDGRQRALAHALAAAGYDLVVGLHPHVVQPVEIVDGVPVIYSIGNYVFTTPGRFTDAAPGYGLVLTTEFRASGRLTLRMRCIQTDNDVVLYQPRPCDASQARALLGSLNPQIELQGDVAQLDVQLPAARS